MPDAIKYLIDAAVAGALFMALLVVFVVDRFVLSPSRAPTENTLHVNVIDVNAKHRNKKLKLAVTPTASNPANPNDPLSRDEKWDDMGKLLNELGDGYRHDEVTIQDIVTNPKKLKEYDVIFLTCAPGGEEEMKDALFQYVSDGGILYASDWRFDAIAKAFPDMVAPNLIGEGAMQHLEADIVDPSLSEALKSKKIHLVFNLGQWKTAAFAGPRVKTLIQGTYIQEKTRQSAVAPLMVKFQVKDGTVIFTSFHNEKQNSKIEKDLLKHLVFSLVTAGVDADVNAKMDQGGFTPQRSNLLSTPERNQSISKTYENKKAADLRFALGFRNEGAKLRFNIKSPDGKQFTKDCESATIFEVPNAIAGTWTYTVTNLHLPYENFPFTVTVGEKK
jgi:hypothetical protein